MTMKKMFQSFLLMSFFVLLSSVHFSHLHAQTFSKKKVDVPKVNLTQEQLSRWAEEQHLKVATFGGGCFWCTEAAFEVLPGVKEAVSGYAGGSVPHPTYEQVLTKQTGHIEVCQIYYDPQVVTYETLLKLFFKIHDPTSVDHQGPDSGPQYRSVVFVHDEQQKKSTLAAIEELDRKLAKPIVTKVLPLTNFYMAESYHQDYFAKNPKASYCQRIVSEKVGKAKRFVKEL
jgi:peptide-methionine (S)-S-oxide reductase